MAKRREHGRAVIVDDGRKVVDYEDDRPSAERDLISNCTDDGRTLYGMRWQEVTLRARRWWDERGRHVIQNRDWRNPDEGLPSGILRGLPFDELNTRETLRVVHTYERTQLRVEFREQILDWMQANHPEWLLLEDDRLNDWVPYQQRADRVLRQVVNAKPGPG